MSEKKLSSFKIGVSAAASWAWGTGFIVGMGTMQQKGLIPFLIWGIANIATLAIFGLLFKTGVLNRKLFSNKVFKGIALVLQCVIIILNMNVINNILVQVGVAPAVSYIITCLLGLLLVAMMYKEGLRTSILTDNVQMAITYICGIALVIMGFLHGDKIEIPVYMTGGLGWAIWSATILLTSPIGDMEMWQRAEEDEKNDNGKAFFIGAGVFSIYVILIAICANFAFNRAMNFVLLGMMIAVCTATIDSAIVCFHELGNKKLGSVIVAILCIAWGVFKEMGIIQLWGQIGVVRVAICMTILVAGIIMFIKNKKNKQTV